MLGDGSDLRQSNFAGVSFQGGVDQGIRHATDISSGFSAGKGLISGRLMKAVLIVD